MAAYRQSTPAIDDGRHARLESGNSPTALLPFLLFLSLIARDMTVKAPFRRTSFPSHDTRKRPGASFHAWALVLSAMVLLPASSSFAADADLEFFEKRIRPVLVQHCYECHAATS